MPTPSAPPDIAAQREENRRRMPETAAFLDEMRKHFGKPAWFRFTEAGLTVEYGERPSWVRERR